MARDLCAFTLKSASKKDVIDRIVNFDRKLELFLKESDFEMVKGINSIFKL